MKTIYGGASIGALAIALVSPAAAQDAPAADGAQDEDRGGVPTIVVTAQ